MFGKVSRGKLYQAPTKSIYMKKTAKPLEIRGAAIINAEVFRFRCEAWTERFQLAYAVFLVIGGADRALCFFELGVQVN